MNVRMLRLHAKAVATLLAGCLIAMFSPATATATAPSTATAVPVPDSPVAEAGNPFVDGWYADPDITVYDGTYWVYPTTSKTYAEQTYLDAFSSTDMVNWTKHEKVLTTEDVEWAEYAVWAPAPVERNGKYYLFFAANDIQNDSSLGGIGVAVADRPEGPTRMPWATRSSDSSTTAPSPSTRTSSSMTTVRRTCTTAAGDTRTSSSSTTT